MKPLLLVAASLSLTACSFAARSPEMYQKDTLALLETRSNDIRACYDGVLRSTPGAQGRVTVKFNVETETGKIANVTVDPANTTAPAPVADCVAQNITGLALAPPDERTGEATWSYDFIAPPPPKT